MRLFKRNFTMTNICKLTFEITCHVHDECADDLGKEMAIFLQESWFNGEDILEVEYKSHKTIL